LNITGGYARSGVFWSDPIQPRASKVAWHRLRADLDVPSGAHAQFFFAQGDPNAPPPAPSPMATSGPFADSRWRILPQDGVDFFIGGDPSAALWIGGHFIGEGASTPALSQMRVEYDHKSYAAYLPAIYRRPSSAGDTLVRVLSLFESFFNEAEWQVDRLPALFDPEAVPERFLAWLAGWLDLTLDESWSVDRKRRAVAAAFQGYARRGTAERLREMVHEQLDIDIAIVEPLQRASCWFLPSPVSRCAGADATAVDDAQWQDTSLSVLGMSTMLAPSSPQGAVVGTTAVLDRSPLIESDAFGEPLFDDLAYQFAVLVHRGELRADATLDRLRNLIEDEKPVHTASHLCVIEPRMRVGFQARIGIDTVVAGPPRSIRLDESALDGSAAVGGHPAGRIGQQTMVGINTRLG
jgi:phage tail-like protein